MTPETLSVVQYVLSSLRRAAENAYSWSLTPNEAGILVAEVERLRGERDHFREAWAAAQVRLDCGTDALEAVREERAAVVAYLLRDRDTDASREAAAEAIQSGEHKRTPAGKEKP